MKKLVLAAAISAIVSGVAFADTEVDVSDVALAAALHGSAIALQDSPIDVDASQTTTTDSNNPVTLTESFKIVDSFKVLDSFKSADGNVAQDASGSHAGNVNIAGPAGSARPDHEKSYEEYGSTPSTQIQAGGEGNQMAGGDIENRTVSASGIAQNQQYQIGGGGLGYWGLPSATAQNQGQVASTDNIAVGGNYEPKSVVNTGTGFAAGFGSDVDDVAIVTAPNSGLIAGDDIDLDDSAVVTAPNSGVIAGETDDLGVVQGSGMVAQDNDDSAVANTGIAQRVKNEDDHSVDNSIDVTKGGTLAQGGSTAVGDDQENGNIEVSKGGTLAQGGSTAVGDDQEVGNLDLDVDVDIDKSFNEESGKGNQL